MMATERPRMQYSEFRAAGGMPGCRNDGGKSVDKYDYGKGNSSKFTFARVELMTRVLRSAWAGVG